MTLQEERVRILEEMAPSIEVMLDDEELDPDEIDDLREELFSYRGELETTVLEVLRELFNFGGDQVRGEWEREHGDRPGGIQLASPPSDRGGFLRALRLLARQAAESVLGRLWEAVSPMVSGQAISGTEGIDRIIEEARELSPATIGTQIANAVWTAFTLGRDNVGRVELGVETVTYSAVLDVNTCDRCEEADGTAVSTDSDEYWELQPPLQPSSLSPGCRGRGRCRCILIYTSAEVFDETVGVPAELL